VFFMFPVHVTEHIRELALLFNTVLLILILVVVELVYSERPPEERRHLRLFYPLILVLVGLLVYAAYLQGVHS
jgi:hypothetical protein